MRAASLFPLIFSAVTASVLFTGQFDYNATRTQINPLKGFVPFGGMAWDPCGIFPCAMENTYVSLISVMKDWNTFDFSSIDQIFQNVASRGRQSIIRLYVDYPGEEASKSIQTILPAFLIPGMTVIDNGDSSGVHPDYNNENLITALDQLIRACGARYDGDPRIAVWQVGLLGHYGEWHNYPTEDFANTSNQNVIIDAFTSSFTKTLLQNRYPNKMGSYVPSQVRMGYIDDSFTEDTFGDQDWYFYNQMSSVNAQTIWQDQIMGGELYPPNQKCSFQGAQSCGMDWQQCVDLVRPSYLWNNWAFQEGYQGAQKAEALLAASSLGYQIHLQSVTVSENCGSASCDTSVQITIVNNGIAPFYYPIYAQVSVTNAQQTSTQSALLDTSVGVQNQYTLNLPGVSSAGSTVAVSLVCDHVVAPVVWSTTQSDDSGVITLSTASPSKPETSTSIAQTSTEAQPTSRAETTSESTTSSEALPPTTFDTTSQSSTSAQVQTTTEAVASTASPSTVLISSTEAVAPTSTGSNPVRKGCQLLQIIIPLYIYPLNGGWPDLLSNITAHPENEYVIILNPNSGPGSDAFPDSNYVSGIISLKAQNNVRLVGYVSTDFGARDVNDVNADVDTYAGWASYTGGDISIDGIFFDQSSSSDDATIIAYYRAIAARARSSIQSALVVTNQAIIPGYYTSSPPAASDVVQAYYDLADIVVSFADKYDPNYLSLDFSILSPGNRRKSALIIHTVPNDPITVINIINNAKARNYPMIYMTDVEAYVAGYTYFGQTFSQFNSYVETVNQD